MSNHQGSYLLNDLIAKLDEKGVFDFLGKENTYAFLKEMVQLAEWKYDCNSGEILDGYTSRFEICNCCLESSAELQDGLCPQCRL